MAVEPTARGVGKCAENHAGSFGYPTRPPEPYAFCSQCGQAMVWECAKCGAGMPEDSTELDAARFCRDCGAPYFENGTDEGQQ
jgi:hypothetical protein